jgi:hypothetical protein
MLASKKDLTATDSKSHPIYIVFLFSTYRDNEKRRKTVQEAISMAEMMRHGMEIFTASTMRARPMYLWELSPAASDGSPRAATSRSPR